MDQPPAAPPPGGQTPQGPDWGDMKNKVTAAQGPDRLILIAGLLFLVATFLPWYRYSIAGFRAATQSAWGVGGLGVLAALLGIGAFALAVAIVVGAVKRTPSTDLLMLVLAGGTLLFTFLRLIFEPGDDAEALTGGTLKVTRGIGLWAGIVLAVVMAVGAFQKYKATQT